MSDFARQFGALVRRTREEHGWSFAEVAARVYPNDPTGEKRRGDVQKMEQGKSKPNMRTLKLYRDGLGLTQDQIDSCRTPAEIELAHFAERLLDVIAGAVAHSPVSDDLASALAERHAEGNPDDFDGALRELQRALEVAAEQVQRGALPSNMDAAVEAVLAEVNRLNADGQIAQAGQLLRDRLADRREARAQEQAQDLRLMQAGIAQAVLERDIDMAVTLELERLTLEAPQDRFEALRKVFLGWCERGRDKGLRFDLEVAIALAEQAVSRAGTTDQRGAALNDLAISLQTLGERESGTARLDQAVAAYRAALQELTRDRVPLHWATTQMNLGNALQILGQRESGTERLEQSVTAYRAALEEWTRDRVPLDWALTQTNLGSALQTLGERESGTARLDQAVAAFRAALEEWTRDRVPMDWAMTQMNLGNALRILGDRESGTERLDQAVAAYRDALKEWTRDRVPMDWANTQMNLGTALANLGEREIGTERLEQAVAACRAALKEYTRDRVPMDWARTQMNLGKALTNLGQRESGTARLKQAVAAYRAALQEWTRDRAPFQWAMAQHSLSGARLSLYDKTQDVSDIDAAQRHAEAAREIYVEAGADHYIEWIDSQQLKGVAYRRAKH